jgi:hypothetical protein
MVRIIGAGLQGRAAVAHIAPLLPKPIHQEHTPGGKWGHKPIHSFPTIAAMPTLS